MKLSYVSIFTATFLAGLPKQSTALKCGSGVTEPCIGDTDVRYNPDVTYNLKEQADFWSDLEGLYIQDECDYDADGTKRTKFFLPGLAEEAGLGSFDFCNMKAFLVSISTAGVASFIEALSSLCARFLFLFTMPLFDLFDIITCHRTLQSMGRDIIIIEQSL